jgi:hypothetical protein
MAAILEEEGAARRVSLSLCGASFDGFAVEWRKFDEGAKASTAIGCEIDDLCAEHQHGVTLC